MAQISPDVTRDDRTGASYYTARITIAPGEIGKLGGAALVPGMPVETFIQTGRRSVFSYLLRPVYDTMQKAFRES